VNTRLLTSRDETIYDELIRADAGTMVYATLPWRDFLQDVAGGEPRYLVAEADGVLVGAFPSFAMRTASGSVINSLPWYGSHGGCTLRVPGDRATRTALVDEFARGMPDDLLSCTVILTPAETAAFDDYAGPLAATAEDERIGQITQLPSSPESVERELELSFRQKTRNLVRKARRQGFERVLSDEQWAWDFLTSTHQANIRAIGGIPKPRAHFDALRRALPPDWVRLSVALDGRRPVAAMLLIRFHFTVEYLTPVIEHDARSRQPLSFLIWEEMVDAANSGFTRWNWGGTWRSQSSLHHFKSGFGADDEPYRYVVASGPAGRTMPEGASELASTFPYYYIYPYA
jgi:GNAT acetyltransferase-like protein